jgi:hypothetical protein
MRAMEPVRAANAREMGAPPVAPEGYESSTVRSAPWRRPPACAQQSGWVRSQSSRSETFAVMSAMLVSAAP